MSKLEKSAWLTLGTGIVSVLAIAGCHLALTDIWHGEGSLEVEWRMVQIGFAVIAAFHGLALVTAVLALRAGRRPG